MLNNKVVATEVLRQYVRVPEVYLVKTRAGIVDAATAQRTAPWPWRPCAGAGRRL